MKRIEKMYVLLAGAPAQIRIWHFPNIVLECYYNTNCSVTAIVSSRLVTQENVKCIAGLVIWAKRLGPFMAVVIKCYCGRGFDGSGVGIKRVVRAGQ